MSKDNSISENLLIAALKLDSHQAFVEIFRIYYPGLVMFCSQFIDSRESCEDIVQDVFAKLWENRKELEIKKSLKSYLTALVQNRAIDHIRYHKVRSHTASETEIKLLSLSPEEHLFYTDLSDALERAVSSLSPQVKETLMLSIFEKLSYPQIAQRLGISVRTVEARMSKALKYIRHYLKDFRLMLLIMCFAACNLLKLLDLIIWEN